MFLESQQRFQGLSLSVHNQETRDLLRRKLEAEVRFGEQRVSEEDTKSVKEIQEDIAVQSSVEGLVQQKVQSIFDVDLGALDDIGLTDRSEGEELVDEIKKQGGVDQFVNSLASEMNISPKEAKKRFDRFMKKKISEASASIKRVDARDFASLATKNPFDIARFQAAKVRANSALQELEILIGLNEKSEKKEDK